MRGLSLSIAFLLGLVCSATFAAAPPRFQKPVVRPALPSSGHGMRRRGKDPRKRNQSTPAVSASLSKTQPALQPHLMPAFTLKILQGSGDFSEWVAATTVNEPRKMLLRWTNTLPNVSGVQWQVSTVPLPTNNPSANQTGILKTGVIEPIVNGKSTIFPVPFQSILPANPPAQPKKYLPVLLAQVADPDDFVGFAYKKVTMSQLLASGPNGIPLNLNLANSSNWEGSYTVRGRILRKN